MTSLPGRGFDGTLKLSSSETPAIAAPDRNTAAGEISHSNPKMAGKPTAAM